MTSNFGLTAHQAQRKALVNLALAQKPKIIPTQTPIPKSAASFLSEIDQSHSVANNELPTTSSINQSSQLPNVNNLRTIPSARKSARIPSTINNKSAL
jgi:hypothetical protein